MIRCATTETSEIIMGTECEDRRHVDLKLMMAKFDYTRYVSRG